jgi:hypothetical protein
MVELVLDLDGAPAGIGIVGLRSLRNTGAQRLGYGSSVKIMAGLFARPISFQRSSTQKMIVM